ncbi:MAG: hypothetical protein NZT92_04790 [Abditibacteriales bacterium]|nr:hypothetical protein [Abditibacteriales bacterium]MDW8365248.1 hypothetical protein [Abditibacteriales bacterium]
MTTTLSDSLPRLLLLTSLLFGGLAYLFVWVQAVRGAPLPVGAAWLIALLCYAALLGGLLLLYWLSDTLFPEFPQLLTEWTERVGVARFEGWGIAVGIGAALLCAAEVPALLPLPVLMGLGFLAMLAVSSRPIPPEETRSLYRPADVPEHQLTLPLPLDTAPPAVLPEGVEMRTYQWSVVWAPDQGAEQAMSVAIRLSRLQEFRDKNPYGKEPQPQVVDFHEFVTRGITGEVHYAAAHFEKETKQRGWTPFHEVCNVLAFVQSLPYHLDEETMGRAEYFRYPIETLADGTGDCEDTSILAAALLRTLQHDVVLLLVRPQAGEAGHVAIGVAVRGFPTQQREGLVKQQYLYCETTAEGWHVGEVPDQYRGCVIEVHPV